VHGRAGDVRTAASNKIDEIDEKIGRLHAMRRQLRAIVRCQCKGNCPIVARRVSGSSSRGASPRRPDSPCHPQDRGGERTDPAGHGPRGEGHRISIARNHGAEGERPEGKSQIERRTVAAHDEAAS
jgi:hypothetical protein